MNPRAVLLAALMSFLAGACASPEPTVSLPTGHPARPGTPVAFDPGLDPFAVLPTYGPALDDHEAHAGHTHADPARPETDDEAVYSCPMHPEVVSHAPGSCPECGMALQRREVPAARHDHAREGSER